MKTLLRVTGLAFAAGLFGAQAHADGSKCVSMDNDIARLACFDEAYAEEKQAELDPYKAVQDLGELVNYDGASEKMVLAAGRNPCSIRAEYQGTYERFNRFYPVQIVSHANLSHVERLGAWDTSFTGARGIQLITDRSGTGSWVTSQSNSYNSDDNIEGINFYAIQASDAYEGRDAKFWLLPEVYRHDRGKVQEALTDLWRACRAAIQ